MDWIWKACTLTLLFALIACNSDKNVAQFETLTSPEGLVKHGEKFKQEIITVVPGVHVAVGYGLANSILLEGEESCVLVDALESFEAAEALKADFEKLTAKPIEAIVYTHNHADHTFGADIFAAGRDIPIFAHTSTEAAIDRVVGMLRPVIGRRSLRMFGTYLDSAAHENAGIGQRLRIDKDSVVGVLKPTRTFQDRLEVTLAGISMQMVHAPGETNDQIYLWLPDKKVLLCGDNYYETFPNLYTIRGTPYRDVAAWVKSLDEMRYLRPEHLIPGHTRPVSGPDEIFKRLTDYRDAIQFVHDQTLRGMNMGMTPDELVEWVRLPPHLAKAPWLQEYYGTVAWSVRSIYTGYLGWFDGNPATLNPLPIRQKAEEMAALAGGPEALLTKAKEASDAGKHQWALELTDHLRVLFPQDKRVNDVRVAALTALGEAENNPNGRHYYLTLAAELGQNLEIALTNATSEDMLASLDIDGFFRFLTVSLNAKEALEKDTCVAFRFPDIDQVYSVHVRRGVAEVQPRLLENTTIIATVDSRIFKEMLSGRRNVGVTFARDIETEGSKVALGYFLNLFEAVEEIKRD